MINWPQSLVEELAARRAIIFIGSGVSASAKAPGDVYPPTWKKLLVDATKRFILDPTEKQFVDDLIEKQLYLDAAEVIFDSVGKPEQRAFFTEKFATPNYIPSEFHRVIQEINAKIVITTNYDQIYEIQCDALRAGRGYAVRTYVDNKILNDIRSKDNLIIKAHGCINKTESIVLTRSDYFNVKRDNGYFYHIIDSLLTVNTVMFIGCGMSDPDIQLVLENTNIAAYSDHPHYAVLPKGRHQALIKALERTYNIKILEYDHVEGDGHVDLLTSLIDLQGQVCSLRPKLV